MEDVKNLVEDINKGIAAVRAEVDAVKGDIAKNAEANAKVDAIIKQVTDAGEAMQKMAQKQAAIEAALNRFDATNTNNDKAKASEQKAMISAYLREGPSALDGKNIKLHEEGKAIEIRAMSTDNNPDGGYLTSPELGTFMVDRVFESTPMRSLANVVTISRGSLDLLIDDNEAGSGWIDEGGTVSETDTPELGKLSIPVHKLAAEPLVTTEMLQDAVFDVEAWLYDKVAQKFGRDEGSAFVSGNGVGKPRGFLTHSAWDSAGVYERNKIEQVNLGDANNITADGLIALQASLKEEYQSTSTWLVKRTTYGNILKLKGADNYFFSQTLLKDGVMGLSLLGRPLMFGEDMPAVAAGNLSVALADWRRAYTIVDRIGVQVLRDPYTKKGYVKFFTTKRVGGAVTSYDAIKIGKVAS